MPMGSKIGNLKGLGMAIQEQTDIQAGIQTDIRSAIEQTDAIFALEGFEPTDQRRAISAAVLAGRVTHAQVADEMREYVMQHKTVTGFVASRAWA